MDNQMTTRHFTEEEFSIYLDGESTDEEDGGEDELACAHLKSCTSCSEALAALQLLRRTARQAAPDIPTQAMWTEIKQHIQALPPPPEPPWRRLYDWLVRSR